jgi:CRP-like cAMP-binding protein
MDNIQKVFILRATKLFSELAGETLLAIAKETEEIFFKSGSKIFAEGDDPDGLYIIVSGIIYISDKEHKIATELFTSDAFGELALLDDSKRAATAIAKEDCTVLFLDREIFANLIDDLPSVLKAVTREVVRYLRKQL